MPIVRTDDTHYKNIADNIRANTGMKNTYLPEEMAAGVNEVYKAGQSSMIDESKIIEKTVSGSGTVIINDISEIPHDVSIQITGGTTDFNNTTVTVTGANICKPTAVNSLTENGVTVIRNADGSITVNGTPTTNVYLHWYELIPVTLGQTFYFFNNTNDCRLSFQIRNANGTPLNTISSKTTETKYTIIEDAATNVSAAYTLSSGVTFNNLVLKPFVSLVAGCEYEDYKEQVVTFDASGKSVDIVSYCPVMMIKADDSITFDINYHKSWGRQAQYNEFWDKMQPDNTTAGSGSFTGPQWNDDTFKPKKDVVLNSGWNGGCFNYITVTDLTAAFERTKTKLDTSKITSLAGLFQNAKVERIPRLDLSNCTAIGTLCYGCSELVTIDGMKVSAKLTSFSNSFNIQKLVNLTMEEGSVIACNGFDFKSCVVLSKASTTSIVGALSYDTTDKSITFSLTAVNNAFETSEGAADGSTSEEWNTLVASKSNWTITLA